MDLMVMAIIMKSNLRYLMGDEEKEPGWECNKKLHGFMRKMYYYKNELGGKKAETGIVEEFEKRYDKEKKRYEKENGQNKEFNVDFNIYTYIFYM